MSRLPTAHPAPLQELRLSSPVYCEDGAAGIVSHLRFHPCCGALTHLVVWRPIFARPRRVVVPVAHIERFTANYVTLRLSRAALQKFPTDTPRLLRALGADWRTPTRSKTTSAAEQQIPQENADCCTPERGHQAIALLGNAMPAVCEDGHAGRLALVLIDPQRLRVLQLLLYHGILVQRTTSVPLSWIESITPRRIRLRAQRRQLADLPPYHSDEEIADDVRYGLRIAPAFRAYAEWMPIGVTTHAGVVLLQGNVRSPAHRREAERIAEQTLSVRHVCNELITDDELAQAVERALHTHTRFRGREIQAKVELGLIELMGLVDSDDQLRLALRIVKQVRGVRRINNLLRVDPAVERVSHASLRDSVTLKRWSKVAEDEPTPDGVLIDQR